MSTGAWVFLGVSEGLTLAWLVWFTLVVMGKIQPPKPEPYDGQRHE